MKFCALLLALFSSLALTADVCVDFDESTCLSTVGCTPEYVSRIEYGFCCRYITPFVRCGYYCNRNVRDFVGCESITAAPTTVRAEMTRLRWSYLGP